MSHRITAQEIASLVGSRRSPRLVDVRRREVFDQSPHRIAGAIWRDHMKAAHWAKELEGDEPVVVYCLHGHNVSEIAACELAANGVDARMLDGGIEAYAAAGGTLVARAAPGLDITDGPSIWVTRERPKIDRIACPWLIRRFIDPYARFHFVSAEWVRDVADEMGAVPFDVEGVHYSHRGAHCTFETLIGEFDIRDAALAHLARIVRGADTARLDLEPQAAGLLAISLGLSATEPDDLVQLERGMILYDALYGWCRHAVGETHNWPSKVA